LSRAPTDRPPLCGAVLALLLAAAPALAERRATDALRARAEAEAAAPRESALRAEVARPLPPAAMPLAAPAAPARAGFTARFAALTDLGAQLRALRHFSVLRLWDSQHVRIFLGFNSNGNAGLQIQQRDPRDWPLPQLAAARVDAPSRAVPLSSP
jgi:hypothetical protein